MNSNRTAFLVWEEKEIGETTFEKVLAFSPKEAAETYSEKHLSGLSSSKIHVCIHKNYHFPIKTFEICPQATIIYVAKEIKEMNAEEKKQEKESLKTARELYEFYRYTLHLSEEDSIHYAKLESKNFQSDG